MTRPNFPTGIKSAEIECENDGKISKQILFLKRSDSFNVYKDEEELYRSNGSKSRATHFYENGSKNIEWLYRSDGSRSRSTRFYKNGSKRNETLYRLDGTSRKYQSFDSSGVVTDTVYYQADENLCSPVGTKCVASDPN